MPLIELNMNFSFRSSKGSVLILASFTGTKPIIKLLGLPHWLMGELLVSLNPPGVFVKAVLSLLFSMPFGPLSSAFS